MRTKEAAKTAKGATKAAPKPATSKDDRAERLLKRSAQASSPEAASKKKKVAEKPAAAKREASPKKAPAQKKKPVNRVSKDPPKAAAKEPEKAPELVPEAEAKPEVATPEVAGLQASLVQQLAAAGGTPLTASEGRKKRARSTKRLTKTEDDYVVDAMGNHIPVPPKHGIPAQHSRPKSGEQPFRIGTMMLRFHARKQTGEWGSAEDPPTATLEISPGATFAELRKQINIHCPLLPPNAQHFHKRDDDGTLKEINPADAEFQTLRSAGYDLPGPHDIWMEIDMGLLFNIAGAPAVAAAEAGSAPVPGAEQPVDPQAIVPQAEAPTSPAAEQPNEVVAAGAIVPSAEASAVAPPPGIPAAQSEDVAQAVTHTRKKSTTPRQRPNNRWTEAEVDNLLMGLMTFGTSAWTAIAERWQFCDRTTIDLKDKWRNLKKNVKDGRPMRGMVLSDEKRSMILRIMLENGELKPVAAEGMDQATPGNELVAVPPPEAPAVPEAAPES